MPSIFYGRQNTKVLVQLKIELIQHSVRTQSEGKNTALPPLQYSIISISSNLDKTGTRVDYNGIASYTYYSTIYSPQFFLKKDRKRTI